MLNNNKVLFIEQFLIVLDVAVLMMDLASGKSISVAASVPRLSTALRIHTLKNVKNGVDSARVQVDTYSSLAFSRYQLFKSALLERVRASEGEKSQKQLLEAFKKVENVSKEVASELTEELYKKKLLFASYHVSLKFCRDE